jgi:cytochrome c peroxidase
MLKSILGGLLVTWAVGGCADLTGTDTSAVRHVPTDLPNGMPVPNPSGAAATVNVNGTKVDTTGDFFTSLGTNGRSCGSCHLPTDGWTIIPAHVQERFNQTGGLDPIFRTNDGSNSPTADVSTVAARRAAYSMLLTRGLIRVGIGVPAGAEFSLVAVDDPYGHANSSDVSLFRRPLPSANLFFLSTVMWDGRETFKDTSTPPAADSNCLHAPFPATCFKSIHFDLSDQANGATLGHAQAMLPGLTAEQDAAIVEFETSLMFAQIKTNGIGELDSQGGLGGPENVSGDTAYFGINDNFGDYRTGQPFTNVIFHTYDAWAGSSDGARAAVARGQAIFNNKAITISGVGGLNGSLGLPASFTGTCGTCHDTPEGGNHSVPAPLNIGIADASRRTADMPLYTFQNNTTGATVQTTDPGRALITGKWADIGKFKGPTLRGLAARAPYFHNGSAANFDEVIDFYADRFGIDFSSQERSDLKAFLATL